MDAVQAVRNRILQLCEGYDLSINRLATLSALQKAGNYSAVAATSAARPMPSMRRGELNIRISVLIELKKIYPCAYDDFFAGLDNEKHREKM